MFDPVDPKQSFPALEHGILSYWKDEDMFRRSVELREHDKEFRFYDGPPFATGLPHYGHLLAGTIKDVIPRYQTMRGKKVQRRFGWDCHGLPIENLIEKEHGIKNKHEIETMGVRKFNDLCRGTVQRYVKEWRTTVERMGRWVDMDWDYRTMDPTYMESIWWVMDQLHDKNLLYEGYKPMYICPRCATPLSNFEVTQGYREQTDMSVIMTFPLQEDPDTIILAWTTTPWSLPGNMWLAVGKNIPYVTVKEGEKTYILAEKLVEKLFKGKEYEITGTLKAKDLIGKKYEPLFPYFVDTILPSTKKKGSPQTYGERVFKVISNDAVEVSDEEGTGIVHITSSTGEDSFAVAQAEQVDVLPHIRIDGSFIEEVTDFAGLNAKPQEGDDMSTDKKVIEYLKEHGRHFSHFTVTHSYPHCWRCDTPLLPFTTTSWFVRVEQIKEDMLLANKKTEWVPTHIRDGRFGNWLENARDWAISRNRYWGTPLPIWRDPETKELEVVGSRDELMQRQQIRFTKITALRHGFAKHNEGHYYQSQIPGVDLTAEGVKQAKLASEFLSSQNVSVIYTSPLARTMQTAQAIADGTGAKIIVDERLREVEVGDYEGKGFDRSDLAMVTLRRQKKLQENRPESIFHLEGMELWESVQKRVASFLDEILIRHRSEHIVIVTHADPIMSMRHYFTREDPFKISHQPFPSYATPEQYFWDHDLSAQMDLHKENVDEIMWPSNDAKTTVELTAVRHGETDWNKEEKVQGGEADPPLNGTGRKQALETAKKLLKQSFDVIIASDLKRASETAEIIAKELGVKYIEKSELLRERMTGEWSGKDRKEVFALHPPYHDPLNVAFHYLTGPKGESLTQFMHRAKKAYDELLAKYAGKRVLLVGHRGIIQALQTITQNLSYIEALGSGLQNGATVELTLKPFVKRIPEVLDCWFESGSMPYAEVHHPFGYNSWLQTQRQDKKAKSYKLKANSSSPPGFPADFIAENLDQTRGWFYTLMVLSTALYKEPAFQHCICGGIVLAEDGRKMSKRLQNYPDPNELMDKHGADALRFALMNSPVVRAETLRFSEKSVADAVQQIMLPLWNSYSFFVTYANLANFQPVAKAKLSSHPLDRWIKAEVQDLVNRMTEQLDHYDLSATCDELFESIDALTNWYIRLSRRRFAGKGSTIDIPEAEPENFEQDRMDALHTLYDVLLTISQLLAPFCPFLTESIYLNLTPEEHTSIHLTEWPKEQKLSEEEESMIRRQRLLRRIVSLGLKIRSDRKIKVRTPLAKVTIGFPPALLQDGAFADDEIALLRQELNVKEIAFTDDPGQLGEAYAQVDARKVGPRLGGRVQEIIQAGKRGEFEEQSDGSILILDETLAPDEAAILYRGREGEDIAAERGVVVSLDTTMTDELQLEGLARDLIRAIQQLRKDNGYELGEPVIIGIDASAEPILAVHRELIEQETSVTFGKQEGPKHALTIGDQKITVFMLPKEIHG